VNEPEPELAEGRLALFASVEASGSNGRRSPGDASSLKREGEALATFFDGIAEAMRTSSAAPFESSAEPEGRLDLVLRMVAAGRRKILDACYVATRYASSLTGLDFDAAVHAHLEEDAGREGDYARLPLGFSARLDVAWVREIADWEESLHRMHVTDAPAPRGRLRAPAILVAYTVDAPSFVRAARSERAPPVPEARPTRVLLHRASKVRWFEPGVPEIAALAEAQGDATEAQLVASGVPLEVLDAGRRSLASRGLLRAEDVQVAS